MKYSVCIHNGFDFVKVSPGFSNRSAAQRWMVVNGDDFFIGLAIVTE